MTHDRPTIVWFRQDLRIADNPALEAAVHSGAAVLPLFVLDTDPAIRPLGGAARWWLDKSLESLERSLRSLGSRLLLRRGRAVEVVLRVAVESDAGAVLWNRLYDHPSRERDDRLAAALARSGIEVRTFNSALLAEPDLLRTQGGGPFQIFSAYWRALRPQLRAPPARQPPSALKRPARRVESDNLKDWNLHPRRPDWSAGFDLWSPGESGAQARLTAFLDGPVGTYGDQRDNLGAEGSSRLSPHLRFGEIAPWRIWRALDSAELTADSAAGVEAFRRQLGWREFHHHLLHALPDVVTQNMRRPFDRFPWRADDVAFRAWSRGLTGYPIVDAGMRQLWRTGWAPNRVRMIVASFLTKHLLIDWREGEAWLWDTLVDADLANNPANWQWVAGSGMDAAPYFRIFNPVLQSERFDPRGDYIRAWLPELTGLPDPLVHQPWKASELELACAGVRLGRDYPMPIVEHGFARRRALAAFETLRQ